MMLFNSIVLVSLIYLAIAQNQAPKFEPSLHYNYFFPEYNITKPGNILLWLNASDYDDDDLQFGVEGDFYNKLVKVKKIDGKHAQVIDNQIFDREVQEKYENIFFYVKDKPGNKVYQSVRFVILDIDDNPPIFKSTPYKVDVSENSPLNTNIFDGIEAVDIDGPLFNKFSFSLEADFEMDLFRIDKTNYVSSGHYKSSLLLANKLDYEKSKSHVVNVVARGENSMFTTTTQVVINIIDFPDRPPEFSQSPYYVKIEEELPVGAFLLKVNAKDGDTGINNPCKYQIIYDENPMAAYFDLDAITGDLTISKRIDLESEDIIRLGGLLEFKIIAIEIGDEKSQTETQINVAIFDLNDNKPKFDAFEYNLKISPKSIPGTSLTLLNDLQDSIHIFDLDKGINGSFSLFLLRVIESNQTYTKYDDHVDFEVVPKKALNDANLIIKLKDSANLTDKMGKIEHYHIFAKDNGVAGNISYSNLMIRIESINQYAPQFGKEFYVFFLDENSPFNTTIDYIVAYDNDTLEDYGHVFYELKNGQDRFQIEKYTGRIFTISNNPNQQLDRELIDTFYISVDAIDSGGLRTSVQIIIKLNDLNDNAPQFLNNNFGLNLLKNNSNYNILNNNFLVGYIEENSPKWLESIKLQAVDRDVGLNSVIVYEIVESDYLWDFFTIDNKTNTIVLRDDKKMLDFEELLEMHSMKSYLSTKSSMSGYSFNKIMLNPGEIDINLILIARDMGKPSLSSKIMAKIIVKDLSLRLVNDQHKVLCIPFNMDVNDHKPKFSHKYYSTQVLETAKSGVIFQVNAIDLDAPNTLNSKISYRIESGGKDKFYIDSDSGLIKITKDAVLDRDLYGSVYTLKIVANDFGTLNENMSIHSSYRNNRSFSFLNETDLLLNVCYLNIEILDVNDKKPEFLTNNDFTVKISENAAVGTQVFQVKAIDPDSNAKLVYFLAKKNKLDNSNISITNEIFQAFDENRNLINVDLIKNWFDINSDGMIFTKSKLDREFAEQINLVVGVEDLNAADGFRPQIQTTVIKIKITDINDNYPIFPDYKLINLDYVNMNDEPTYEAYESIEENTKINTKLLQLKAIDFDKNRNITYKIIHSTARMNLLLLDSLTGEIYVNGEIDHEKLTWINLTIIAFDSGKPYQKHSLLLLNFKIEDLNDNEPIFFQPVTEFYIYENSSENTVVAKFNATDLDSGQFGTVFYKLINGDEGKFSIDSQSGVLYTKKPLDREEQDLYTFVVQAKDNQNGAVSQQLSDSLLIKIRILDVNDNKPYCENEVYNVETIQNADENTTLIQVVGLDKDIGKNAQIVYSLKLDNDTKEKNLFRINSSNGQILVNKKLHGFSGLYSCSILLKDNNGSEYQSNKGGCTVNVLIKDFNSHPPKFNYPDQKNQMIRLKSSLPIGSYVATVNATDPDNDPNGHVVYYLDEERKKNNDWKSFNIDSKTGVLTLNTKLNLNKQAVYSIDIIASDQGRPTPLSSRITLTLVLVDDFNNSVQFNKMQICVSGLYQCDANFQTLFIRIAEEKINNLETKPFRLAKINDLTKTEDDICYYLSGQDSDFFELNEITAVLKQKLKLDREVRDKYEVVIKATEHCFCLDKRNNKKSLGSTECYFLNSIYDPNDMSQFKISIHLDDINDNTPKFSKKFYQIGITSEVEFGEMISEFYATDLDSESQLNFSILSDSLIKSPELLETDQKESSLYFPFKLDFYDSKKLQLDGSFIDFKQSKFTLKTQKHFREQDFNINQNRNNFYQFNLTVSDQDNRTDSATFQIVLINKQQRVKLVFSQPLERVIDFQHEFRTYINNLTGFVANIDKISLHRSESEENEDEIDSTLKLNVLTDMFLHFVRSEANVLCDWNVGVAGAQIENNIISADTILNILDKSKDFDLFRKYKLSLAEKHDDQGISTYYKYGSSAVNEDFNNLFSWSNKNYSSFVVRIIFCVVFFFLLFFSMTTLIICCCMRQKYKKKRKTEKALIKAFGLEQCSISYNDAISGYVNTGFDSNSLLPIPGTNLYSYEGSNPIWLRKYDKIENKTLSSYSSPFSNNNSSIKNTTTNTTTPSTTFAKSKNSEECLSFFLKHDSPPCTSRCSSSSENIQTNGGKTRVENITLTSEVLSFKDEIETCRQDYESSTNNNIRITNTITENNYDKKTFTIDPLLTFASDNSKSKNNSSKVQTFQLNTACESGRNEKSNSILFLDNTENEEYQKKYILISQQNQKDFSDLFEVESTVI